MVEESSFACEPRPHDWLKHRPYKTMIMFCCVFLFFPCHIWRIRGWIMFLISDESMTELTPPHEGLYSWRKRLYGGKEWAKSLCSPAPSIRDCLELDMCLDSEPVYIPLPQKSLPRSRWILKSSLSLKISVTFFCLLELKGGTVPPLLALGHRTNLVIL